MKKLSLMVLCIGLALGLSACCCRRGNNLKCCPKVSCAKPCPRPCKKRCPSVCPKPCTFQDDSTSGCGRTGCGIRRKSSKKTIVKERPMAEDATMDMENK